MDCWGCIGDLIGGGGGALVPVLVPVRAGERW